MHTHACVKYIVFVVVMLYKYEIENTQCGTNGIYIYIYKFIVVIFLDEVVITSVGVVFFSARFNFFLVVAKKHFPWNAMGFCSGQQTHTLFFFFSVCFNAFFFLFADYSKKMK